MSAKLLEAIVEGRSMTKCKACKQPYTRTRPMQVVCGHECAIALARATSAKKAKAEARKDRAETKKKASGHGRIASAQTQSTGRI